MLFNYTHKDLVEIAYKWVVKNGSVGFAFKELKSISSEIPDVIGFNSWESILIECNASRSDFFRDKAKPHRSESGMGNWRFFCCPKDLIRVDELPEKWGLIYVNENGRATIKHDCRIKKVREECISEYHKREYPQGFYYRTARADENRFEVDTEAERAIMYTALRRMFIKGHLNSIYDKEYNRLSNRNLLDNH